MNWWKNNNKTALPLTKRTFNKFMSNMKKRAEEHKPTEYIVSPQHKHHKQQIFAILGKKFNKKECPLCE